MGDRQAGMCHEITQQVKLFRRKVGLPALRTILRAGSSSILPMQIAASGSILEALERRTAARILAASSRMLNGLVM